MAQAKDVVIQASQTTIVSGTGSVIGLPEGYTSAIIVLDVTAQSGTTPTLNLYVQEALPCAAAGDASQLYNPTGTVVYDDVISFTQVTTSTGRWVARIVGGGNAVNALSDGALTAATARSGPLGKQWRLKWVIAGTSPSYTWSAVCRFIP